MKDIFELLGRTSEFFPRLRETHKKIFIYGYTERSKALLLRLTEQNIYVEGFIVADEKKAKFLNKRLYAIQDLAKRKSDILIIDFHAEAMQNKDMSGYEIISFIAPKSKEVAIYGAGYQGEKCCRLLQSFGIRVLRFYDRNANKQDGTYLGLKVISPEKLARATSSTVLVVAMDPACIIDVVNDLQRKYDGLNIYMYYEAMYIDFFAMYLFPPSAIRSKKLTLDIYHITFPPFIYLNLLYYYLNIGKQMIIYGEREDVLRLYKTLGCLDIHVAYGVDCHGYYGNYHGLEYKSAFELYYESVEDTMVLVLQNAVRFARQFIRESGINERLFYQVNLTSIRATKHFEPNLGYSYSALKNGKYEIFYTKSHNASNEKKIGIIGGSTSDVTLFNEMSWPEHFVNILNEKKYSATVHAYAVGGYVIAQELVRFIRDLSHLHLDLLISYSGFNDHLYYLPNESLFVHPYQRKLFDTISKLAQADESNNMEDFVHIGNAFHTPGEHWLHYETMLHDICLGLGIKFHAIFQSYMFRKKTKGHYERNLFECMKMEEFKPMTRMMRATESKIKKLNGTLPWLTDFSGVFDDCEEDIYFDIVHLNSKGNFILANKIFELIQNDLR